jgi:hypothetical protein
MAESCSHAVGRCAARERCCEAGCCARCSATVAASCDAALDCCAAPSAAPERDCQEQRAVMPPLVTQQCCVPCSATVAERCALAVGCCAAPTAPPQHDCDEQRPVMPPAVTQPAVMQRGCARCGATVAASGDLPLLFLVSFFVRPSCSSPSGVFRPRDSQFHELLHHYSVPPCYSASPYVRGMPPACVLPAQSVGHGSPTPIAPD